MKKEEKIVMKDDVKTHSWTLRKELLGFEVGMSYYSGFVFSSYLCIDKLIILTLNRMLMKQKKAKFCEKSVQLFGSVDLFTYFCR